MTFFFFPVYIPTLFLIAHIISNCLSLKKIESRVYKRQFSEHHFYLYWESDHILLLWIFFGFSTQFLNKLLLSFSRSSRKRAAIPSGG